MKRTFSLRRAAAPVLMLALAFSLALPASAFFWNKKADAPYVADFSKNGLIGSTIVFAQEDFAVKPDGKTALSGITIDALPDPGAGSLCIGSQPVEMSPPPRWSLPPPSPLFRMPLRPPQPSIFSLRPTILR